ncbi:hypothetical protein VTL71DRAFT_11071 [Oculimacula yallundae]|uniref:Uncharacterized protein n=1 Tax=Oculimacula yallundae TaxID=86028 RepID=A0ABR4CUW4_9HELO
MCIVLTVGSRERKLKVKFSKRFIFPFVELREAQKKKESPKPNAIHLFHTHTHTHTPHSPFAPKIGKLMITIIRKSSFRSSEPRSTPARLVQSELSPDRMVISPVENAAAGAAFIVGREWKENVIERRC